MSKKKIRYDKDGYDKDGYDKWGFDREGYDKDGYDREGYKKDGYNEYGYNRNGYKIGYDEDGYDKDGYDEWGFDREGIHRETNSEFDPRGYKKDGFNLNGHNRDGFRRNGIHIYTNSRYDKEGYDINGWNKEKRHKETHSMYGPDGFTINGFSKKRKDYGGKRIHKITHTPYDEEGYDYDGYDKDGYGRDGFNIEGFDRSGYGRDGFNDQGLNREGKTREEVKQDEERIKLENQNQRRKNYLGLIDKAKKLSNGEMTLEEYVMKSKTSIEELIAFAKKEHLLPDVIRGLYKYKGKYKAYIKPFRKQEYLRTTTLIIDDKEVKPTEQDVDMCIEYLTANDALVCDKTVRDTIRGYLKGEIDITERTEESEEGTPTHDEKEKLVKRLLEQQEIIAEQKIEINSLRPNKEIQDE